MSFSNTYDTTNPGSAVSNREDLSDGLYILAPEETPVLSMSPKGKAKATFHEWTVDKLDDPVTTGIREGSDVTDFADKHAARARLGNYIQHMRRTYKVSKLQNQADSVGPADLAKAEMKAVKEIKRDIEATLISTNDRSQENGTDTGYAMRGLGDWIDSSGPSDVPASYRTPSGSIHASSTFTEGVMRSIITSIYRSSGESQALTLVADTALRKVISDFAQAGSANDVRRVNYGGGDGTITLSVEQYKGDHGIVNIVNMNPVCAPDTTNKDYGYFINTDYLEVAEFLNLGSERLPDLGGGPRGFVDWAGTLVVKHPAAFGKVTVIA